MKWYNRVEFGKMGCVMKNPPFEITQAMLTDAAEIAELVGRLSTGKLSSSPILRRTNRLRTIQCKRKTSQQERTERGSPATVCIGFY